MRPGNFERMRQARLNVKVLDSPENAVSLLYSACRQCYSSRFAGQIFEDGASDAKKEEEFIREVTASGHESPLEHAKFTFAVEGVSRILTHQLVRHRIASYSQQSQRYVKESAFDYIIPPSIKKDPGMRRRYIAAMKTIQESYDALVAALEKKGGKSEAAKEDARFILPQAVETKIVVTMNCRELLHFFKERCCMRAQWEIRELAEALLKICRQRIPAVFGNAGAKCIALGYCPESERFTCGRFPLRRKTVGGKHDGK